MSSPVLVGREATHGTLASTFMTVGNFTGSIEQGNKVRNEARGGQDIHFAGTSGRRWESWKVSDSLVYHDSFGLFLAAAMGAPTVTPVGGDATVNDNVFKFTDDPTSLSFKWTQAKRALQGYQSLYGVVDKLDLKFSADGDLLYSSSGIAKAETEIATPTFTYTTTLPFNGWEVAVLVNGSSNARLVEGSIGIARNRKPRPLMDGTQDVAISIGDRSVEWDFTIDFDSKSEYDRFKAASNDSLQLTFTMNSVTIGSSSKPTLTVKLGTTFYEGAEIDDDKELPTVKAKGKALYNPSDASSLVMTLRALKNFATI